MQYPSRRENYAAWIGARYAVQFDYSAYFDQFQLDEDARRYMTLRTRKIHGNDTWFLTRLPMGANFSPAIAQFTTWVICEPLRNIEGVTVSTMIDNVRITAETEEGFVEAVRLFLKRSDRAGLTLNTEALPFRTKNSKELAKLGRENVEKEFEFLGVCYHKETVKNTKRLLEKLRMTNEMIKKPEITRRHLAHIIGLAIFMAHTINECMVNHFDLMREYNKLFEGTPEWDEKIKITEQMKNGLLKLTNILQNNKPQKIKKLERPSTKLTSYDAIVVFDACKDAWAAKIHDVKENTTIRILKRFKHQVRHSAHTEPMAAAEVIDWLKENRKYQRIALITDHKALALGQVRWWTGFGGHSTAYHINEAFKRINDYAEVFHVDGKNNICDSDSRSREARQATEHLILVCDESWDMNMVIEHPYANERKQFKFFLKNRECLRHCNKPIGDNSPTIGTQGCPKRSC